MKISNGSQRVRTVSPQVFLTLYMAAFAAMLGVGIIAPFIPLYAESMGATGIWLGIIYASFSISRTIFMPLIGKLSDKNGRKVFILLGLSIYAICSLCYVWASNPQELTLVRLFQGTAGAMIIPIAQAYIGDLSLPDKMGMNMGYFNTSLYLGFGSGPFIGGFLSEHFGMDTAFYAMGLFCLLSFFLALFFLPELHLHKKEENSESSLTKSLKSDKMKGLVSFRLSNSLGRGIFSCFIPVFAGIYLGLTKSQIGILLGASTLLTGFLQTPFGKLADKFSREKLVVIGNLTDMAYLLLIPHTQNFYQLLALGVVMSIGRPLSLPASSALVATEGKKSGMGSSFGIFGMAMSAGMMAGPILGGVFCDWEGLNSAFYFAAIAEFLGTVLFLYFMKKSDKIVI